MKTFLRPARARRFDPRQRAQWLADFERSGMSAAAFARQHHLRYTTFCNWRQRSARTQIAPAFVQVEVTPASAPSAELVLELGAHARVRLHSAGQLALAAQLLHHVNHLHAATSC